LNYHTSVLLQQALHHLAVKPGGYYVDATLGGGGHTQAILAAGGNVLGLDQNQDAIDNITACLALPKPLGEGGPDLVLAHTNFTHLKEVATQKGFNPAYGILFDLGVSSHQIDTPIRGFSFQKEGPLDMRMGESAVTAEELVNQLSVTHLVRLFKDFGEIPQAGTLAKRIVASRPITTTAQLAQITGVWTRQAFQALRIAVNDELGALETGLHQALEILNSGGNLVVITFHSLEDRMVKQHFKTWSLKGLVKLMTNKPIIANDQELAANSRSKSAKLRAIQKL